MNEDLIKEVVREMIRNEEIVVKVYVDESHASSDDFGNAEGCLDGVSVEVYLAIEEN